MFFTAPWMSGISTMKTRSAASHFILNMAVFNFSEALVAAHHPKINT
jgi:hypothetical protein